MGQFPHARILIARHGRTVWNRERRRQGREDIPLDTEGRRQALELRNALRAEPIDLVYVSPLRRSIDTARPLAREREAEMRIDPDLTEFDFGVFSGTGRDVKVDVNAYRETPVPGGESLREAWRRAARFVERITPELVSGRQPLVVGHRRQNRLLVGALFGLTLDATIDFEGYRPANASVVEVVFERENDGLRARDLRSCVQI